MADVGEVDSVQQEKQEEEFTSWLESTVLVDEDGVPIAPKLVEDKDEGEDGEFEK